MSEPHLLYVGAQLPKRSETFVYREVLGLRDRGVSVGVASVHPPEQHLGDPRLDALAAEAIPVYGRGVAGKLRAVVGGRLRNPAGGLPGLRETPPAYWPKHALQVVAGDALARRVRGRGFTHVHAHMAHVPATVAMACARSLGVPFSFTGHAADLFRDRSALRTKLRRAAFVACISHWHRGFYRELVPGLTDARLPVIRCGVDLNDFAVVPPVDQPHLVAVGRLVPKKGFDVLLRALARDEAPAATRLTLAGDGPEGPVLRRLAKELGLTDRIRFAGALSNEAVRDLMAKAAAFVLPCRQAADGDRDGIPVVLMEAMARGVPVISGDLPTIRELVSDKVSGLMVPPGDPVELALAIARLLTDEALRARLGAGGRARVTEEFSQAVNLERLLAAVSGAATTNPVGAKL